jgi:ubiquitin-protein ligase
MSSSQSNNIVISKQSIQRLLKDVRDIIKNPLNENGIFYIHDDEDMLKGYALIIGPSDTPYFGGYYFFEFKYPPDYPHSPPHVTYCTNGENIRFNPNLYSSGKVCISLLNTWRGEQWTSCQTISTVLLNLCTLLNDDPLLNEPGVTNTHHDYQKYNKIIQYKNIDIAVLKIFNKHPGVYMNKFEHFYPTVREHFFKNKDEIQKILEQKLKEFPDIDKLTTGLYGMSVVIDYEKLYKEFMRTVEKCLEDSSCCTSEK